MNYGSQGDENRSYEGLQQGVGVGVQQNLILFSTRRTRRLAWLLFRTRRENDRSAIRFCLRVYRAWVLGCIVLVAVAIDYVL
jgi:hypothetical protein